MNAESTYSITLNNIPITVVVYSHEHVFAYIPDEFARPDYLKNHKDTWRFRDFPSLEEVKQHLEYNIAADLRADQRRYESEQKEGLARTSQNIENSTSLCLSLQTLITIASSDEEYLDWVWQEAFGRWADDRSPEEGMLRTTEFFEKRAALQVSKLEREKEDHDSGRFTEEYEGELAEAQAKNKKFAAFSKQLVADVVFAASQDAHMILMKWGRL